MLVVALVGGEEHRPRPNSSSDLGCAVNLQRVVASPFHALNAGKKLPFESAIISALRSVCLNGVWALDLWDVVTPAMAPPLGLGVPPPYVLVGGGEWRIEGPSRRFCR
jgi:hypothetical protein